MCYNFATEFDLIKLKLGRNRALIRKKDTGKAKLRQWSFLSKGSEGLLSRKKSNVQICEF